MVESSSRGWLGAGPKKSGRPAPQITIVRSTMAPDPFTKSDRRQGAGTGTILSVTGSVLIGTCSIKQPRQDRNSAWDPVAGWKVAERRKNSLRQDREDAQSPFAREKDAKQIMRQDWRGTQSPLAKRKAAEMRKIPSRQDCEGTQNPVEKKKKQRCRLQSKD